MTTTHNLPFEAAPWEPSMAKFFPDLVRSVMHINSSIVAFRVGTCDGIYTAENGFYQIIAIKNDNPGNGHFEDVLQWFEASCIRDKKGLMFMEIMNEDFGKHLERKRGFKRSGHHMVKTKF